MSDWIHDGHTVELEVHDDHFHFAVRCPGPPLCKAVPSCEECGGNGSVENGPYDDGGPDEYRRVDCDACAGTGRTSGCFVREWCDADGATDFHHGAASLAGVSFPREIRWRAPGWDEGPEWRFAAVVYEDEA